MASNIIDVYVKLASGKTLQFDLSSSDTMGKVYRCVAEKEGVSEDRVTLKYTGKILKKEPTLGRLGVCAETILKAEIQQIQMWSVIVTLPSGETIPIEIQNVSPVSYIQDQIHTQAGIPTKQQILKHQGTKITNIRQSLISAGLKNEALLKVEQKEESSSGRKKTKRTSRGESVSSQDSDSDDLEEGTGHSKETKTCTPSTTDNITLNDDDKEAIMNTFDAAGKRVDVVFSFDTTGSMFSCLQQVRQKLKETVERLIQHIPRIRIGVIAHGDYCDYNNYVLRQVDLTSDVHSLVDFVKNVPSTGGGDTPECYEWVLHKAQQMDWAEDSAKALVVIGDCKPHEQSYTDQRINWHDELDLLKGMGVKVYGVKAMQNDNSEPFYQELSDRTGGAYIIFRNFSIISEMFMAVCYREASEEQFQAFCEEVDQDQEVTSDQDQGQSSMSNKVEIQQVLNQLKEQKGKQAEEAPSRYIAEAWWDPELDKGRPGYSYNPDTDTWGLYFNKSTHNDNESTDSGRLYRSDSIPRNSLSTTEGKKTRHTFSFRRKSRGRPSRDSKKACTVM